MDRRLLFGLLVALSVSAAKGSCHKGWDFSVAMTENKLNEAFARLINNQKLGDYEKSDVATDTGMLKLKNTVRLEGLTISSIKLNAVEGQEQEGKVQVTFSAGEIEIFKVVTFMGQTQTIRDKAFPMSGQTITFRAKVTAYKINFGNNGSDKYKIQLEIVSGDAIVGALNFDLGLVTYVGTMREALSEQVRNVLKEGNTYGLGTFHLPKRNQGQSSLIKDLFPKALRFSLLYAPHQQSVIAALGTTHADHTPIANHTPIDVLQTIVLQTMVMQPLGMLGLTPPHRIEGAFRWSTGELIPAGMDAAVIISGEKFMKSIKPVIASQLPFIGNTDLVMSGCTKFYLSHRVNDFKGTTDLKKMSVEMYEKNELQIKMELFDHVSQGITVDIFFTVRLSLTWNKETKEFDVDDTYRDHKTVYHRDWWVILLEVITLGIGRLVTMIIESIANIEIRKSLTKALNFDPSKGGLPTNVGGVMGEVIDKMQIGTPQFYGNNFMFPFHVRW